MEEMSRGAMQSILNFTDKDIREIHEKAKQNLAEIGLVNPIDAFKALSMKDSKGRNTTLLEIREFYLSPDINTEDRDVQRIVTLYPEISFEGGEQFGTLILTFENNRFPDMNRIWQILETYGKENIECIQGVDDYPILQLTVLPLMLDGKYGFVISSPIMWFLTPADPSEETPRQIRMLLAPGTMQFVQNENFSVDDMLEELRRQMAAYQMDLQRQLERETEEAEYQQEMEKQQKAFIESNVTQHTFGYDAASLRTDENKRKSWGEQQRDGRFKVSDKKRD